MGDTAGPLQEDQARLGLERVGAPGAVLAGQGREVEGRVVAAQAEPEAVLARGRAVAGPLLQPALVSAGRTSCANRIGAGLSMLRTWMIVIASLDPMRTRTSAWPSPRGSIRPPGWTATIAGSELVQRPSCVRSRTAPSRPWPVAINCAEARRPSRTVPDGSMLSRSGTPRPSPPWRSAQNARRLQSRRAGQAGGHERDLLRGGTALGDDHRGAGGRGLIIVIRDAWAVGKSRMRSWRRVRPIVYKGLNSEWADRSAPDPSVEGHDAQTEGLCRLRSFDALAPADAPGRGTGNTGAEPAGGLAGRGAVGPEGAGQVGDLPAPVRRRVPSKTRST